MKALSIRWKLVLQAMSLVVLAAMQLVGVSLAPLEEAMAGDLQQSLIAAAAGVAGLSVALWVFVGRTLRRVAAISRRAATITSTNLHERLPVDGSGDELDRLSRVFNEMLSGLGRSLEQMESFTSDAAHQLRTPLTRVRGELDLVLRDGRGLPPDVRARLVETRLEVERLARTCSRLLLLASLDRGAMEEGLRADDVDLLVLLEDTVEQVGPLAAERGVEVRSTGREGMRVRCCRPLLLEALLNLFDNAMRASPAGTTIEVSLRRFGKDALVTISDQGPGIPEELREQVFRRFSRSPRQREGGTGLGLSIVRGIARAHGGEVHIETAASGGAALVVALPLSGGAPVDFAAETPAPLNRAG